MGKVGEKRKARSSRGTQVRGKDLFYRRGMDGGVIIVGKEEYTRGRGDMVQ